MLKQRVLTASILFPFVIFCIFVAPIWAFVSVVTIVFMLSAWEWSALMGLKKSYARFSYLGLVLLALLMVSANFWALVVSAGWWLIALSLVLSYPTTARVWTKGWMMRGIMGLLIIVPTWGALNILRIVYTPKLVFFVLCLIWVSDIAAYFVGRQWGKRHLAPQISPGKTIEGLLGGLIAGFFVGIVEGWLLNIHGWIPWMLLVLITLLASVLGDLCESMFKRQVNLKNSGQLLPGHGGMLDRVDSMTAALPIFTLGFLLLVRYL